MRFKKFDMNLLVVLDALLTEKNITKAGSKIFLSQSATSGALARLREYFDDPLLVQVGRKMLLTPLAESLIKPVHDLLLQTQNTLEIKPVFEPSISQRHIKVILSDYSSTILMPKVIRAVSELAPNITFELMATENAPIEDLEHGKADFLIMPDNFLSKDHPCAELYQEGFVCIACAQNEDIGDALSVETYLELGHVTAQFGSSKRQTLDGLYLNEMAMTRRNEILVSNFNLIPINLIGTKRIATIHKQFAEYWASLLPIKIIPLPIKMPILYWKIQWHQYRAYDPCVIWIKDLIVDMAQQKNSPLIE